MVTVLGPYAEHPLVLTKLYRPLDGHCDNDIAILDNINVAAMGLFTIECFMLRLLINIFFSKLCHMELLHCLNHEAHSNPRGRLHMFIRQYVFVLWRI